MTEIAWIASQWVLLSLTYLGGGSATSGQARILLTTPTSGRQVGLMLTPRQPVGRRGVKRHDLWQGECLPRPAIFGWPTSTAIPLRLWF
jgi:hypothetical protein